MTLAYASVDGRDYSAIAERAGVRPLRVGRDWFSGAAGFKLGQLQGSPMAELDTILASLFDLIVEESPQVALEVCEKTAVQVVHSLHHGAIAAADRAQRPVLGIYTSLAACAKRSAG